MTDVSEKTDVEEFRLLDFFKRNGACNGAADLFFLGEAGRPGRLGDFVSIFRGLSDGDGPAFTHIVVVLPPNSDVDLETVAIRGSFSESLSRRLKDPLTPRQIDQAFRNVRVVSAVKLEGVALGDLVAAALPKTGFVIADVALYRAENVEVPSYRPSLPEDLWAPHLHAVVALVEEGCEASKSYVVLDAGKDMVTRPENRDLILTIKGAVTNAERQGSSSLDLALQHEDWRRSAEQGRLDPVLREIDSLDASDQRKTILKAQMFKFAGAFEAARTTLEAGRQHLDGIDPDVALQVAILAEDVDADEVASILLQKAIPELRSLEFLGAGLELADRLGDRVAAAAAEAALSASFPASEALLIHRAKLLVRTRQFREAAKIFREVGPNESDTADFYELLAGALSYETPGDVSATIESFAPRFPARRSNLINFFAQDLEARGHRAIGIGLLLGESGSSSAPKRILVRTALSMVERGRLMLDQTIDEKVVRDVLATAIEYLALHPSDADMRVNLIRVVSPEVLGSIGLPTVAKILLDIAGVRDGIRPSRRIDDREKACPPERLAAVMRHGFDAMAQGGAVMGHFRFPEDALTDPPAAIVRGFAEMIEHMGSRAIDDGDVRAIEACLMMATAIAPLGDEPNEDLVVLRLTAGRLAFTGRMQRARDLAEQGLRMAGDSPHRRRLAWFAFADIYARAGNLIEALVAAAVTLSADSEATWDQIWYESLLLLRLFRDLGILALARPLLEPARLALREMGAENRYADRLDTVELQLDHLEYTGATTAAPAALLDLADRASKNLERVLDSGDEPAPATILLANIQRTANLQNVDLPATAKDVLARALSSAGGGMRALLDAVGSEDPAIGQVVSLAKRLESPRFAENAGYDVRTLVVAARRLLNAGGVIEPATAVYAVEAMSDQAAKLPTGAASDRLLDDPDGPAAAAREISAEGLAVVVLGLAEDGLVRVVAVGRELGPAVVEPSTVFSSSHLADWKKTYPYAYSATLGFNEFFTSTDNIGVSELPERAVLVTGVGLQGFPADLLRVGPDLAGRDRRLATAPSLAWLVASRRLRFKGDGRIAAWIPDAEPEEGLPTLAILSERLRDTFERHEVVLSNGTEPPLGLEGADVVIVAAHGGVAEDKRYFRVVTDDVDLALASSTVSGALGGVGVVILFVCSGGRLDQHPGASTTVGLAKRLLDNGCRAVVAPPWPLQTNVPPRWLPAFLESWSAGAAVIDACFDANVAVRNELGDNPATDLAMAVYGDPLVCSSNKPEVGAVISM